MLSFARPARLSAFLGPTGYKVVARLRPKAGSHLIVIPTAPSGAIVLEAVKV